MTTHNEKTPATAPTVNEGNELGTGSSFTAYLSQHKDNTDHTFGTFSGESVPIKDHITMILPLRAAQLMYADGPQLIDINRDCAVAQSAAVRKAREEREEKERNRIRRDIARRVEEEEGFEEQLAALDAQATEIYRLIDKKVDAILATEEGKK